MRFDNKVALVTGAGSGIGRATALAFAQHGARVAASDVNTASVEAVAAEIKASGGTAIAITADMAERAAIEAMVARTMQEFGRVDILFNNAFGLPPRLLQNRVSRVAEINQEVWDYTLQVGLTGVMQAARAVLPIMQAQGGGAIINTASISGLYADYGIAAYNVMKAAVANFTRVVALEYGRDNIRCNSICPGPIDTPLLRNSMKIPGFTEKTVAAVPLGRLGRPEEMAGVVLFLASDYASYVNGAEIVADGGMTAHTGIPSRFPQN